MRRMVFMLLSLAATCVHAADGGYLSAVITTEDGVIRTDKLVVDKGRLDKGANFFVRSPGGERVRSDVPYDMIDTITISAVSKTSNSGSSDPQWKISGQVETNDGRSFPFEDSIDSGIFTARRLIYHNPDPITGKSTKQSIAYKSLKAVRIGSINGPFMVDSAGKVFPPDYVYSPYTAEKLTPQVR